MPVPLPLFFLFSLGIYSFLRIFDELSTRQVARVLDLQIHEVNPILTRLIRLFGVNRAFQILWLITGAGVASLDTLSYASPSSPTALFDVPMIALLVGSVHLLAAAHNWELKGRVEFFTKEEITSANLRYAARLRQTGPLGRVLLSLQRSLYTIYASAIVVVIFILFNYSPTTGLALPEPTSRLSFVAYQFLTGFILFAPAVVLGNLVIMRRLTILREKTLGS